MFDSFDEQEIKDISNDVTNDIDIDQNEVLLKDLRKTEFVVKGKSLEKISKKIKPKKKKKLERFAKKNKRKLPKRKTEKRFHKKGQ